MKKKKAADKKKRIKGVKKAGGTSKSCPLKLQGCIAKKAIGAKFCGVCKAQTGRALRVARTIGSEKWFSSQQAECGDVFVEMMHDFDSNVANKGTGSRSAAGIFDMAQYLERTFFLFTYD